MLVGNVANVIDVIVMNIIISHVHVIVTKYLSILTCNHIHSIKLIVNPQ